MNSAIVPSKCGVLGYRVLLPNINLVLGSGGGMYSFAFAIKVRSSAAGDGNGNFRMVPYYIHVSLSIAAKPWHTSTCPKVLSIQIVPPPPPED